MLYGIHPVAEALRAGRRQLVKLRVRRGRGGSELVSLIRAAAARGIPVQEESESSLQALVADDAHTQGVVLEAGPLPISSLEALASGGSEPRWIVAIDGVEDPQNLGAIARVAEAAGARGLLLSERRSPPLGPAVGRASAGAIERLPVARVPNLSRAIKLLKSKGFWVFGADHTGGEELFSMPDRLLAGDVVIVLGGEGRGLRPVIRNQLDHRIRIPMQGEVASLNVATAAAVVLFDWVRRFRPSGENGTHASDDGTRSDDGTSGA